MDAALTSTSTGFGRRLGTFRLATIVALIACSLMLVWLQLVSIGIEPILMGFAVVGCAIAALVASGRRWPAVLGLLWLVLVLAGNAPYLYYDLTHPSLFDHFAFSTLFSAVGALGIVASIGAIVNHNSAQAPAWFGPALLVLAGVCTGAIGVAAMGVGSTGSGVEPAALAQLPGLEIQPMAFGQKEIKAKVGETVAYRLDNADVAAHSFDIDELNVHTQVVAGASALTLFRPTVPGTYTFYCALPGHRESGMVGTLVVDE